MTIEIKKYMNIKKTNVSVLNVKQIFFKFYDQLSEIENYDDVDKSDFWKLRDRIKNERKKKNEINKTNFQKRFHFMSSSSRKDAALSTFIQ